MLQTTKAIFGDQEVMCPLCRTAPEGRVDFLTECKDFEDIRLPLQQEIQDYLPTHPTPGYKKDSYKQTTSDPAHIRPHPQQYQVSYPHNKRCDAKDGSPIEIDVLPNPLQACSDIRL